MDDTQIEPGQTEQTCTGWYTQDGRIRGSLEPMPGRCGAKLRKTNPPRYCMRYPCKGRNRCYKCGGKTLVGPACPQYATGEHSRHLPKGLLSEAAESARKRGQAMLSLFHDVSHVEARIADLEERLTTGENGSLWDDLAGLVQAATDAGTAIAPEQLKTIIDKGQANDQTWRAIIQTMHDKASLVQVEMKRQQVAQELKGTDEIWETLVRPMISVVLRHIADTIEARSALMNDLRTIPMLRAELEE